jgi:DNA polymerase III epsilon subunit-like protein
VIPIERGRIVLGRSTYREVRPNRPLKPGSIAVHGLRPVDLDTASSLGTVVGDLHALAGR